MDKTTRIFLDKTAGAAVRQTARVLFTPFMYANYDIRLDVDPEAYNVKNGALVVANHLSRVDAAIIVALAWKFAWLRPTAWHREYDYWAQKWLMASFGTVRMGSPKNLPDVAREANRERTLEIIESLIRNEWGVLAFPEGSIGNGSPVNIPAHHAVAYEMAVRHPEKPIMAVTLKGLERSRFGKGREKHPLLSRIPVDVRVRVFNNVDTSGGCADFNRRLSNHFNEGTPL